VSGSGGSAGVSGGAGAGGVSGSGGSGGAGGNCGGAATCNLACPYGFVTDPSTGCPLCQCNPPPACTAAECGAEPPFAYPVCQSGQVKQAYCARGTDGACAWNGPTCVPCPLLACPYIACPVTAQPQAQSASPATGCPTCGCTPVATQ
jgi:hypothetical protein